MYGYMTASYMTAAYLQVLAPSSIAYTADTVVMTKGTQITQNSPTYAGETATLWSVSPSLPSGLSFNTSTGVITGTPSVVAALANYTVTASNDGGSGQVQLTFTVNDIAPSSLSYSASPMTFTKTVAISSASPTVSGGTVTGWSISPSLPSGLSFNTSTGVISGTPSVLSSQSSYTVTASNSGGETTCQVSVTVNDVAPSSLSYASSPMSLIKDAAISPKYPTVSGGTVTSWSVSPSLPSGLSLNGSTGIITGTPTAASSSSVYTVTASNSGGSTTFGVQIAVTVATPLVTPPVAYVSGSKAVVSMSRSVLQAHPKVANHPTLSEQAAWQRVSAVYVNENIPYGDTDRIVGMGFKGPVTLSGKFKAQADTGDSYKLAVVQIKGANNAKVRIEREDLESPEAFDISVG